MSRTIENAHIRLQRVWEHVETQWPKRHPKDPVPFLTEVDRSRETQQAYYAQGRRPIKEVNSLRRAAGLAPITEQENRRTITNSKPGRSKHELRPSEAIDVWFARGKQLVDDDRLWAQLLAMVLEADPDINWGGYFKSVDKPHFELM